MNDMAMERLAGLLEKAGGAAKEGWTEMCRQVVLWGWVNVAAGTVLLLLSLCAGIICALYARRISRHEPVDVPNEVGALVAGAVSLIFFVCAAVAISEGLRDVVSPGLRLLGAPR